MSITVTLTPDTRSGICSLPLAALATESVTFTGADLADGVIVTVMQPDGTPVAIGTVAGGAVELNLNTREAYRATVTLPVGETTKAFLVIGDTDALRFAVPILLVRNYLDNVIPPTASVPVYPTKTELDAILVEIDRIQGLVADQLEEAGRLDASMQETVTNFNSAVAAADTMLQRLVTEGVEEIGGAKTAAVEAVGNSQTTAVNAVADAQAGAVQAVQNKATEVSGEFDGKVTAAETARKEAVEAQGKAENAQHGAEQAQTAAETAAGNADASATATEAIKTELQDALENVETMSGNIPNTVYDWNEKVYKALFTSVDGLCRTFCVYTMSNGWVIVSAGKTTIYRVIGVFDENLNLITKKFLPDRDLTYTIPFLINEVDGVAYIFTGEFKMVTVSVGSDGLPIITDEEEMDFGEIAKPARYRTWDYGRSLYPSFVLGRHIVFLSYVYDTVSRVVHTEMSSVIEHFWYPIDEVTTYANLGGYITKFSLDENGGLLVENLSTTAQANTLVLSTSFSPSSHHMTLNQSVNKGGSFFNYGAATIGNGAGHGSRYTPSQLSLRLPSFYVPSIRSIIALRGDGSFVAWMASFGGNQADNIITEYVLCNINMISRGSGGRPMILGMDSDGLWFMYGTSPSWYYYTPVDAKVVRVRWEDIR